MMLNLNVDWKILGLQNEKIGDKWRMVGVALKASKHATKSNYRNGPS